MLITCPYVFLFFVFKPIIGYFFSAISFSSCSKKLTFVTSTVVPAAQGSVKITKDDNKNNIITINIINLTDPARLQPAKSTYVVWMETENSGIKNIGQFKSTTSIFSNALKGTLTTVTPYKPKRIFLTAENQANLRFPGTQTILTTP